MYIDIHTHAFHPKIAHKAVDHLNDFYSVNCAGDGTIAHLLERDTVADPLLPVDGHLPVTRPEPDPAALDAAAQDPDLAARWERRLAEVTAALDARGAAR